jgi:hypothetical protein
MLGIARQEKAKRTAALAIPNLAGMIPLAKPALSASGRSKAAELDQASLVRMERQSKLLEPRAHCFEKPICIGLALKTDDLQPAESCAAAHP